MELWSLIGVISDVGITQVIPRGYRRTRYTYRGGIVFARHDVR